MRDRRVGDRRSAPRCTRRCSGPATRRDARSIAFCTSSRARARARPARRTSTRRRRLPTATARRRRPASRRRRARTCRPPPRSRRGACPGRTKTSVPGAGVELVVAERERRAAAQHDVHLLVAVALGVLLDHALSRLLGAVGVRAEGADPEAAAHRPPDELAAVDGHRVELVDVRDLVSASTRPPQRLEHDGIDPLDAVDAHLVVLGAGPVGERLLELARVAELAEALGELRARARRRRRATCSFGVRPNSASCSP